jgi:hypothetical protein
MKFRISMYLFDIQHLTVSFANSAVAGAMSPLIMDLCYSFPTFLAVSILFGFSLSAWPAVTSSMLVMI